MTYSAVVLNEKSHKRLVNAFSTTWENEEGWETISEHMTINMGKLPEYLKDFLGEEVELKVIEFAGNDLVKAVSVECRVPSTNKIPHITLAVNRKNGGKPVMSNNLTNWTPVHAEIYLKGIVKEI